MATPAPLSANFITSPPEIGFAMALSLFAIFKRELLHYHAELMPRPRQHRRASIGKHPQRGPSSALLGTATDPRGRRGLTLDCHHHYPQPFPVGFSATELRPVGDLPLAARPA